jgi:PAS domain S-box-containing protein
MPIASRRIGPAPVDKYRALFDHASDAILTVREDGTIDDLNQAAEELTGYVREDLARGRATKLSPVPGTHRVPERTRPFDPAFLSNEGTFEDVAVLRNDGYVRLVDLTVRHIPDTGEGCLALVLLRDVGEKKRMERELITKHAELRNAYLQLEKKNAEMQAMQETLVQAGKMAALGELAFGIAHELNQPLMAIRGYAQELAAGMEGDERKTFLSEIISAADKMAGIISHLRTHVRKSGENFEQTSVHHAVEEALKMLSRQFQNRGIQVHRDFQKDLPQVFANPLQLEQVFINLATNARDAIDATGRGAGNIWISSKADGDFVEVVFRDDGVGMSDKTKQKAFNPFFTTKEVGKGMGLGLSLSYGVIAKLHGSIVVESELGKGTAFRIRLPRDYRELA